MHSLGLVEDRFFISRIFSLVSGSSLRFWVDCWRAGNSWTECKFRLLGEYFPKFVLERMIRDLVVFHFQGEGQALRASIEEVFATAEFLRMGLPSRGL